MANARPKGQALEENLESSLDGDDQKVHEPCPTRQIDLSREMDAASDALPLRYVTEAGLDLDAYLEHGGLGVARAEVHKCGFWQPCDDGVPVLVAPVFDGAVSPERLVDLAAWLPSAPGRFWRRSGWGVLLGWPALAAARRHGEPMRLHPTPQHWIADQWRGACILDWQHGLAEMEDVPGIVCDSVTFAEHIERRLKQRAPRLPAVMVEEPEAA